MTRSLYSGSSLADLYDEIAMSLELRKAHQNNGRAVRQKIQLQRIKRTFVRETTTAIIELSKSEICEKDSLCFVMMIRGVEILFYFHHNDKAIEVQF